MGYLGFYYNMLDCIGCKTCQVSCKDKNNLKVGTLFRRVKHFETGIYPTPGVYYFSGTCNHCDQPKCVEGCPTRAMHISDDGTVQHDANRCIGCFYCTWNCPYGVPQVNLETGKSVKCNACKDLRGKGENPVCVDACVMRCLEFGDLDQLRAKHGGEKLTDKIAILPDSGITQPSLLINPKSLAFGTDYQQKEV